MPQLTIPRSVKLRLTAVVPAYNEAANLPSLIAELRDLRLDPLAFSFVIVNDGSSDATGATAKGQGATVINLPINLGIGVCVQTGFVYAVEHGADWVVQVDGDGQHVPEEIKQLLPAALGGGADVVIGSRFAGGQAGGMAATTPMRRLGGRLLSFAIGQLTGLRINDPTSGFRLFNRRAAQFVAEHYPDDYPEVEVLVALAKAGFKVSEVPVRMRSRQQGKSSINLPRSAYYMIKVILASVAASLRRSEYPRRDRELALLATD